MSTSYSGVTRRFAAYLIDVVVQLIIIGIAAFLLEMQSVVGLLTCGAILFAHAWLYFALMESSKYQATVGKLALGLKVVTVKGQRLSFLRASGRFFGKIFSRLFLGLGFVMMLFTKKRQCLHDKLVGAVVIKK